MDPGLRNARLNFCKLEKTHMMENIIYNELRVREFNVDVGIVPLVIRDGNGNQKRSAMKLTL